MSVPSRRPYFAGRTERARQARAAMARMTAAERDTGMTPAELAAKQRRLKAEAAARRAAAAQRTSS